MQIMVAKKSINCFIIDGRLYNILRDKDSNYKNNAKYLGVFNPVFAVVEVFNCLIGIIHI